MTDREDQEDTRDFVLIVFEHRAAQYIVGEVRQRLRHWEAVVHLLHLCER